MGKSSTIFFNSGKSLEQTVREISDLLSVSLHKIHDKEIDFIRYEGIGLFLNIKLYDKHNMENDRNMKFEKYIYLLDFTDQYRGVKSSDQLRQSAAMVAYQLIMNVLKYPALLVEDMQRLVEQSDSLSID